MKPLEGKIAVVAGATRGAGRGIAVQVDHTVPLQVANLFEQVGEFDILINDIWGGDDLVEWGKNLWETKLEDGLTLIDRAIKTHIITSYHGIPVLHGRQKARPRDEHERLSRHAKQEHDEQNPEARRDEIDSGHEPPGPLQPFFICVSSSYVTLV